MAPDAAYVIASRGGLAAGIALGLDVEGVDGLTGRHKQSIALAAAEA